LINQIAAYEVLRSDLTRGYNTSQQGLTFIGDTTAGEFDLHASYFHSLKAVSPAVAGYSRISDIIGYESDIITGFKKILQAKTMTATDMNYLNIVYINMAGQCARSIDELLDIVTPNTFTMTDDERIKRIDAIYADLKDKYAFSQSFSSQASLLSAQRQSTIRDIQESMINYGLQ
jgi:hypothetical protein